MPLRRMSRPRRGSGEGGRGRGALFCVLAFMFSDHASSFAVCRGRFVGRVVVSSLVLQTLCVMFRGVPLHVVLRFCSLPWESDVCLEGYGGCAF